MKYNTFWPRRSRRCSRGDLAPRSSIVARIEGGKSSTSSDSFLAGKTGCSSAWPEDRQPATSVISDDVFERSEVVPFLVGLTPFLALYASREI